ncbi:hypothetical protein BDP55DRAFT_693120 [Colletotrichum godetiae]|uniref:Uncharacterized protein n=1 Tax=Colletotrichum godetiae TaxID=1209918 RepID=A0AAJ0EZ67_9PEZI|nr:uncharacterized protein BDP55DRAFT_693120 [Colletotrichum godetiae]KAK1676839.1 hypothetical protein BDP55DRAFT_693120 [Colletotrichum godetiae]
MAKVPGFAFCHWPYHCGFHHCSVAKIRVSGESHRDLWSHIPHAFWDSDAYKTTEAACNLLLTQPNDNMLRVVEDTVEMIRETQHPDGFLNSFYTVRGVESRWTNLRYLHELYCLSHLGRLLEVEIRSIHHMDPVFGREKSKKRGYPDHQEIEFDLLRLDDMTGDLLALKPITHNDNDETCFHHETLARGADPYGGLGSDVKGWFHGPPDYAYNQAHRPIGEQTEIRGHAIRAMYYYTAVVDLVRRQVTSDPDVVECKQMYVTGAVGAYHQTEGFGEAFVLNDLEMESCYGETCACSALIIELRPEYADVMEKCLYNGFLGDISSDGAAFYDQNALRTRAGQPKERERWFACCSHVAKLVGSLGSLLYSTDDIKGLMAVHPCVQSEVELMLADTEVRLSLSKSAHQLYAHPRTGKDEVCLRQGLLAYCLEDMENAGIHIDHIALGNKRALKEGSPVYIATTHGVTPLLVTGRKLMHVGVMTGKPNRLHGPKAWEYDVEPLQLTVTPYFLLVNCGGNGTMRVWTPRFKIS